MILLEFTELPKKGTPLIFARQMTALTQSVLKYDHNNLPKEIRFLSGASTAYIYSADGVKLQTVHNVPAVTPSVNLGDLPTPETVTSVTDYCGPFVYEDGKLSRINLENGYLNFLDPSGHPMEQSEHIFYLRDHLGNNRVSVRGEGGGIVQVDHYYPFGLPMGCGYNMTFQRWRFGGKEMDRTAGLDLYDFEARPYDPTTARFTNPDILAEKFRSHSPFAYCANNPLIFIDPSGMNGISFIDNENKTITIKANYYVVTQNPAESPNKKFSFNAYTKDDINEFNNYEDYLNNLNLTIQSGEYEGYSMYFDLTFEDGGNVIDSEASAYTDVYDNENIGNVIRRLGEEAVPSFFGFSKKYESDGSYTVVGGKTADNNNIIMNTSFDTKMNRIHEIFHTFGLKDGAKNGIMNYPPKTPNNSDAKKIMDMKFLPIVYK